MLSRVAAALVLFAAPAVAQDVDGADTFEQSCAGCHAADGPLSASSRAGLEQQVFAEALEAHPDIGGVVGVTEDEIAALHAYISEHGEG